MNQIATRNKQAVATLRQPEMSGALTAALRDRMSPHPDVGPEPVRSDIRAEARRAADVLEQSLRPASQAEWLNWLRPIAAVCANTPTQHDFQVKVAGIISAMSEVPAAALTASSAYDVMRSTKFFPTVADLYPILSPLYAERRAELSALRSLSAAPEPEPKEWMTAEEREKVSSGLKMLAEELLAKSVIEKQESIKPRYLRDDEMERALVSAIEGASSPVQASVLEFRLKALRQKMGARDE